MLEYYVNTLGPGDVFRDWLVEILGDRISNKYCETDVFKYDRSSHTVCKYKFRGEGCSVIVKFFAEPRGKNRSYDAFKAMMNEYNNLKKAGSFINVPKPIAVHEGFNCALVTEYISGRSLMWCLKHDNKLFDRLTSLAYLLRSLHENTRCHYNKEKEFANFHHVLDQLSLNPHTRQAFNELLGKWWYSSVLDVEHGCMIHRDVSPLNYIFHDNGPYALDLESCWHHANNVRDLGTFCAELKNYFQLKRRSGIKAEPYIGHFLWEYSKDKEDFSRLTRALPFFMSVGLLRIARLHGHSLHYQYLLKEAGECLETIR
ncbi:phosphotransferase [Methanolobus halotolerans]|uniref:Serine/threonine protein phosphatase n=1 Tax=Methanolobus halotolerans TaxID=2052935 RepID=A0A4E0Q760_9EURY|nr:phosphotransferase [Methanolobus halotolerans]TGC10633.1 serine/threonine protein phosphatase [Methanolobus halotolerans]